ncbi:MAG: response regulator [Bacteriovoracaceae bacterium]
MKGKTALIVDDEEFLREIISEELQRNGIKVLEASNGAMAFDIFQSENPDIIITDIRMPGGNGIDLLKRVKAANAVMPVVLLMTAFSDYSDDQIYDMGADAIFSKPFKPKVLVNELKKYLVPLKERLIQRDTSISAKLSYELTCTSLEDAQEKGVLKLGRCGIFIQTEVCPTLSVKDFVHFKIKLTNLDKTLEGLGICQWIRRNPHPELRPGYGLEIVELNSEAMDIVLDNIEKKRSLIPQI